MFSIGEFEVMYGGLRMEYLYKDFNSNHSFGLNVNKVKKRNYRKNLFEYLDYETTTAHINYFYFDERSQILSNISYGKYLAKDKGFTFDLSRRFDNGLVMGAFFSLTDMSLEDYGEGSFDKGVYISIPFNSIFSVGNSKAKFGELYKPLTRDGGAKVMHPKQLSEILYYRSESHY